MKIAIGADHRGYHYKQLLQKELQDVIWHDVGAFDTQRSDYPLFAHEVSQLVHSKQVDAGILLCGTGIGMAIVANRYTGIYAGVVWNVDVARLAKEDDNSNILVIPADFVSRDELLACVNAWRTATFKSGRYQERLALIDEQ
jgi:ribose 5-phosphate isomerase B